MARLPHHRLPPAFRLLGKPVNFPVEMLACPSPFWQDGPAYMMRSWYPRLFPLHRRSRRSGPASPSKAIPRPALSSATAAIKSLRLAGTVDRGDGLGTVPSLSQKIQRAESPILSRASARQPPRAVSRVTNDFKLPASDRREDDVIDVRNDHVFVCVSFVAVSAVKFPASASCIFCMSGRKSLVSTQLEIR